MTVPMPIIEDIRRLDREGVSGRDIAEERKGRGSLIETKSTRVSRCHCYKELPPFPRLWHRLQHRRPSECKPLAPPRILGCDLRCAAVFLSEAVAEEKWRRVSEEISILWAEPLLSP